MSARVAIFALCASAVSAVAGPQVTPAAQLEARATDPLFVGYISASGSFTDSRSCDYTATISTSGSYVQCCPTTGACPFYTGCSSNTLLAAGTSVPCDPDPTQTCNTAIVLPTVSAAGGPSFIACWQKSLGNNPFTFVQNIGGATVAPATTASGTSSSRPSGSGQVTSGPVSTTRSGATTTAATTSSTPNAAVGGGGGGADVLSGGIVGMVAMLAQALL